jgi:serine/threonine-protein kinase
MTRDPKALFDDLSRKVADGAPIDWSALESGGDPAIRAVIDQMRVLAELAHLHRDTLPTFDTPTANAAAPPPPLQVDDTWGHLTVRGLLGRGAHSHVYRAWDSQLDREVALKLTVEPDGEHGGKDIIGEARLLAKVRHPHVATLYGAERRAGLVGLWMELVDGETLETLLHRVGRFNAREAALIGIDVCSALSAVHAAGLLHRDVKAQNVMRDRNGRIVLMDLGTGRDASAANAFVYDEVGTPLYMAPELFEGGKATVQSDIYSVGVLLFRLVTGGVPVDAPSASSLRLAHRRHPSRAITDLRSDLPLAYVRVVERALAAVPADRYSSAGALRMALAAMHTPDAAQVSVPPGHRELVLSVLAAIALVLAVGGWWRATSPRPSASEVRFDLSPTDGDEMESLAFSPDGERLAYTSGGRLRIRRLNDVRSAALEPPLGARDPFWAPDGHSLAFFAGVSLWRVSAAGGEPQFVAPARRPAGGSWNRRGALIYSVENGMALMTVAAARGTPRALRTQVPGARTFLWWPSFTDDGAAFIYSALDERTGRRTVFLGRTSDPPTSDDTKLLELESNPALAAGRLYFVADRQLKAQRLDVSEGRLVGAPVSIAHDVGTDPYGQGEVELAVSGDGAVAYVPSVTATRTLQAVDRAGRVIANLATGDVRDMRVSPDGTMLAYEQHEPDSGTRDIWVLDLQRGSTVRVSQHPAHDVAPTWAPDNRRLYYLSRRGAVDVLVGAPPHGGGDERVLLTFDGPAFPFQILPDGRTLLYERQGQETGWDIWVRDLESGTARPIVRGPANEQDPVVSPDGRWLAYSSPESEGRQVYLTPIAGGRRWRVSKEHGRQPLWSADGRTLYYHGHDFQLMRVTVDASRHLPVVGAATALFVLPVRGYDMRYHYAIVPDGSRVIVNVPPPVAAPVPARVILNAPLP